jgi:glutamate/tyrosine decarboxylase-like PLP-dependent enzyme
VQGGTVGNLSALVVARAQARKHFPDTTRWVIACSEQAHSSIASAAQVMDVDVLEIAVDEHGKLQGDAVGKEIDALHSQSGRRVFAVVATAGTTNLGIIDDLAGIGAAAKAREIWFHVDGAYGLAALCAPSVRSLFNGIENADSLIVDPHKWLFAPYDACALIYRAPELAREVHTQHASYLDTLHDGNWNPSDYAIQLTRRTRGLPFWFSLAAYGTDAYSEAMEQSLEVAKYAAQKVSEHPNLSLLCEPELSIVAFTRTGWTASDYQKWSDELLTEQVGFIPPSSHDGQPILRFAIVNPWTKFSDIDLILQRL